MSADIPVYDYAVRYCLTRHSSYAYDDAFVIADQHWDTLAASTRRDVSEHVHAQGGRRWPLFHRYGNVAAGYLEWLTKDDNP